MAFSLSEKLWILFQITVLCFLSFLLYQDFNQRINVEGEKVIGTITFKNKTVQRKYASHVVWEDLEKDFPLRNRDSIRTTSEADAEITLNDGTKINLSENSMILLNLEDEKTDIDFAYGSVSAKTEGATGSSNLRIKSGDSSVAVGAGDVKLSKTENKGLDVTVEKGVAEIFSFGGSGQKIGQDQKASLGADNGKLEIKKVELKLVSPADNTRYFSQSNTFPVSFEFSKDTNVQTVTFQIASSSDFKTGLQSKKTNDKQVSLPLKEGTYYWRISAGNDLSPTRKVTIYQNKSVTLVSPSKEYTLAVPVENAYVSFSWTKNDLASNYRLDVSPSPDFNSNLKSSVTKVNYLSMEIPKGKFYWRVGANLPTGSGSYEFLYSNIQSFEITDPKKAKPPVLFNPSPKSVVYSILMEKKGLFFNWSGDQSLSGYEFQLSKDLKFDSILQKKSLNSNFLELKESLSAGIYYWRVLGKTKDGQDTDLSQVSNFEVKDINSIKTFSPEPNISLSDVDLKEKGLVFSWEKLPIKGKYQLLIAEDPDFKKVIKTSSTENHRLVIKEIGDGTFYWKVALLSNSSESYLNSNVSNFSVRYAPEPIRLFAPKVNAKVKLAQAPLLFQWSKGNTSSYEFKLFVKDGDQTKEIHSKILTSNEYKLDIKEIESFSGPMEWSVLGIASSGEKSKETRSKFILEGKEIKGENDVQDVRSVTLLLPLEAQSINISKSNEILFKWSPIPGIKKYKFSLYDNKKEIYNTTVSKSDFRFSKLDLLDRKTFRWAVSPLTDQENGPETSGTFKIELDAIKEDIEILSPDVQYEED
ncbi:hypothetical protein LPTSP4_14840 [Leptospira ryugenii]|uniref:FecR protein domain-containing protein n=1 Tax=Leptospira ryugenii TaxID=1917863 RepID=A0A2P2DZA9_9LEPT|nr:FecR family protein [Leptospira ryugenii]GBF49963.1 hypothetical protein LPTSP4_14840 [Leptospira ryugenii]